MPDTRMHSSHRRFGILLSAACSIAAASGPDPPLSRHVQSRPVSLPDPPLCRRFPYHIAPARDRKLTHLQRTVAAFARELPRSGNAVERGVIIYLRPDGSLRTGPLSTGDFHSVTLTAAPEPGEVIIAVAHTHAPSRDYVADQRKLSAEDITLGRTLSQDPRTSPRLLLYVIDIASATISEYPGVGRCSSG